MVHFTGLLLGAALAAARDLPEGVISFPLSRSAPGGAARSFSKRDSAVVQLANQQSLFTTTLQMGSNNQSVLVQVDTGSSDLWVMARSNPYCYNVTSSLSSVESSSQEGDRIECLDAAMFDPSDSKTFVKNDTEFATQYGDYSFANGTYGQDTVVLGGMAVHDANFAVAYKSNSSFGVFGIGLVDNESEATNITDSGDFYPTYPNIPTQLYEQGLISALGYSLWLNDVDATAGELLFGGVDHTKYNGTLSTVPLISNGNGTEPSQFQIMLNGISVFQGSRSQQVVECAYPALLDSGTTLMLLPSPFLSTIVDSLNSAYTDSGYIVPCGIEGGLKFNFSGAEISVPFEEFLYPIGVDNACVVAIDANDDQIILGDTFLRSAYVVYDLENLEVSIANTVFNVTSSSIEAWNSTVPGATKAPGYSSTDVLNEYSTSVLTDLRLPSVSGGASALTAIGNSASDAQGLPTATSSASGSASASASSSAQATSASSTSAHKNAGVKCSVPLALLALALI